MGRARSPESVKAEKMYREGMKLVDIAKKLGVPDVTVRRWKSTQKWDDHSTASVKKKQSERSEKRKTNADQKANVRKPGPPEGSRNALGNKGNRKHGAYSSFLLKTLSVEEKEALEAMEMVDPLGNLYEQLKLYTVREIRLTGMLNDYRENKTGQISFTNQSRSEVKRVFDGTPEEQAAQKARYDQLIEDEIDRGERKPGRDVHIRTDTENRDIMIARLEDMLTRCSSGKTKILAEIQRHNENAVKLEIERQKMELEREKLMREESGSASTDDWIASVMGDADG